MTTPAELRKQYDAISKEIALKKSERRDVLFELRENCDHSDIGEAPYTMSFCVRNGWPDEEYDPPFRVCLICGKKEVDGIYKSLKCKHPRTFTREELQREVL